MSLKQVNVNHNGQKIATITIDDEWVYGWPKEDVEILYMAIVWEKMVHSLIGKTELWYNPWIYKSERVKNFMTME
jgi:hypothetical protein